MRRHAGAALASALAILLASVLLAVGILLYRPLPTIDGHVRFLGLRERGEVRRDGFGVPYILARNAYDLYFLQGYVTAQDRLFQMDLFRRIARSDSERVLGPPGRAVDMAARSLDVLGRARADLEGSDAGCAPRPVSQCADAVRQVARSYAAGVNKFIEQHADGAFPVDFLIQGHRPIPWSEEDVVAIFHAHALVLGWSVGQEAELLRSALGHAPAAELGVCWSVPGSRTISGSPLLAGEMSVAARVPTLWHEVALELPGVRVAGLAIPGVPGVLAGRNDRVAWILARLVDSIPPRDGRAFAPTSLAAILRLGAALNVLEMASGIGDLAVEGLGACYADASGAVGWTTAMRFVSATGMLGDSGPKGVAIVTGTVVDLGRDRPPATPAGSQLIVTLGGDQLADTERSRAVLNALRAARPSSTRFGHPLSERYGLKLLDVGPVTTRYGASGRPAVRFIADLADPDRSWSVLPTGQSGHLISPHRTDQAALWGAGRLKPVGLRSDRIGIVEGNLVLRAR